MSRSQIEETRLNEKFNYASLPPHFIGLNKVDVAEAGPVKDFVLSHEGHTVITSVSLNIYT